MRRNEKKMCFSNNKSLIAFEFALSLDFLNEIFLVVISYINLGSDSVAWIFCYFAFESFLVVKQSHSFLTLQFEKFVDCIYRSQNPHRKICRRFFHFPNCNRHRLDTYHLPHKKFFPFQIDIWILFIILVDLFGITKRLHFNFDKLSHLS